MKGLILLLAFCALGCEPQLNLAVSTPECTLPPELCEMDDMEFSTAFDALSEQERVALIAAQVKPELRSGFVSISVVSQAYSIYGPHWSE